MIRSTFGGFNTSLLGLMASQKAIDVTGQNLSNINTQGYTRQRLDQVSMNPPGTSLANSQFSSKVGQGVMITGVSQIRDPFLDIQYRNQLPKVGTADAMDSILAQIGQIFDETDKDAIAVQFNDIISQLQNLADSENTGTDSADMVVRSACEVLLNTIRQNGTEIQALYDEIKTKLDKNIVPDINQYLKDIVEKNIAIKNTQVLGNPGLELMDARNEMIDELATYFPIEVKYEKQNLGGGIVVDILNIDLKLADGTKVRLVADNKCGEVGIAKNDDGSVKDQPVEFYAKSADEVPKTYGGGLEVLKTELPREINDYIDQIAGLNEDIKRTNDQIARLQNSIAAATSQTAATHQDKMNGYIDTIVQKNTEVAAKMASKTALQGQIDAKNAELDVLRENLRNATTAEDRQRIRGEIEAAQNDLTRLSSDLNTAENERRVAESQRLQALNRLKEYFPVNGVTSSVGADGIMTVGVITTSTTGNPPTTTTAISDLVSATNDKGEITDVDTDTDPITYSVTGANGSQSGTANSSNAIREAIDSATGDMEKQIKELQVRIPQYEEKRLQKVEELQEYFPNNAITYSVGPDDIMSVFLSAAGATAPAAGDPILVSMGADGSQKGSVSLNTNGADPQLDVTGYGAAAPQTVAAAASAVGRITGSINDKLSEGVMKGNLDMVNKSEVFDADITDPDNQKPASDTKGIQYYQKMLDSFINKLATIMNEQNMTEKEVPVVNDDGTPAMVQKTEPVMVDKVDENGNKVTDVNGNVVQVPQLDADGKVVTRPVTDENGNPVMVQRTEKVITQNPLFQLTEGTTTVPLKDAQGNVVQTPQLDADGNVKLDVAGNVVMEDVMVPSGFTALNIKVSDAWMKGDVKINTKRDPLGEGNSSDNWNVDKMIDELSKQTHSFVDPKSGEVFEGTLYECYTSIQGTQAIERKATSLILNTRTTVLDQIADDKDSVSGVWMDEEVMSLMKYSQSYNAASRLMTVMDEVLERLISQTGVCGR